MMTRLVAALAAFAVLTGCSGAGASIGGTYDPSTGMTQYRTSPVRLGQSASGGYVVSGALELRAEAECFGEGCTPQTYTVSISNNSSSDVAADVNQVVFTTPEGTVSFEPGDTIGGASPVMFYNSGRGELVRITLPVDVYTSFATSRDLSVRIGSQDYRLAYDARAPLRRILPAEPAAE